jgi:fucose permease
LLAGDHGAEPRDQRTRQRQRRAWFGIAALFLINGFTLASWISRIPTITGRLELEPGQVGTALMALAAGALVAFPLTARSIQRWSSGPTLVGFALVMLVALPFVGLAPQTLMLMMALFVLGFGNGGMDVSMNAQGIEVERFVGGSIINSLHGFFSLGAFLGAAVGAGAAQLAVPPLTHFLGVVAVGLAVVWVVRGWLIPDRKIARKLAEPRGLRLPPRSLWLLGLLALATSVSEGAMADWSGLYLHESLGASSGIAALGFAAFSVAMLIGRFSGDKLVRRFGAPRLVRGGGLLAALVLGLALVVNQPAAMLLGFAAVGLGLSVVYPLVFSAAGNHPELPAGSAVASVASLGYGGFLAGPPLLGWLAQMTSLQVVMGFVVILAALVALLADATRTARTQR